MININLIQFTKNDFETLLQLEFFHQDPFDRMIISQAISNNLIIISNDSKFDYYKINRKW